MFTRLELKGGNFAVSSRKIAKIGSKIGRDNLQKDQRDCLDKRQFKCDVRAISAVVSLFLGHKTLLVVSSPILLMYSAQLSA